MLIWQLLDTCWWGRHMSIDSLNFPESWNCHCLHLLMGPAYVHVSGSQPTGCRLLICGLGFKVIKNIFSFHFGNFHSTLNLYWFLTFFLFYIKFFFTTTNLIFDLSYPYRPMIKVLVVNPSMSPFLLENVIQIEIFSPTKYRITKKKGKQQLNSEQLNSESGIVGKHHSHNLRHLLTIVRCIAMQIITHTTTHVSGILDHGNRPPPHKSKMSARGQLR